MLENHLRITRWSDKAFLAILKLFSCFRGRRTLHFSWLRQLDKTAHHSIHAAFMRCWIHIKSVVRFIHCSSCCSFTQICIQSCIHDHRSSYYVHACEMRQLVFFPAVACNNKHQIDMRKIPSQLSDSGKKNLFSNLMQICKALITGIRLIDFIF
jgi:hypothetical protein